MPSLPTPAPEALQLSLALRGHIQGDIAAAGGWISFARYMELALYAPGLGYYSAGSRKFGQAGDFVTAPDISSLFGQTLARQVAQILTANAGNILELGAGSGALACDLLLELETLDCLPSQYAILEVSADLRERQEAAISARAPRLASRVVWLTELPNAFSGCIIANEVLDALPAHVVAWSKDGIHERGVSVNDAGFVWQERPAQGMLLQTAARLNPPPPYLSEINLAARAWVTSLAETLRQGAVILIDYGFPAREFYHPQRHRGTLMCHYRQHAHDDPFYLPGLQDITSHVDFSAIAEAGRCAGLELMGYATQAQFLINCGITEVLARTSPENVAEYLPLATQALKLMNPSEMGELFKVLVLGKGISAPLIGFAEGDKSRFL